MSGNEKAEEVRLALIEREIEVLTKSLGEKAESIQVALLNKDVDVLKKAFEKEMESVGKLLESKGVDIDELSALIRIQQRTVDFLERDMNDVKEALNNLNMKYDEISNGLSELPLEELKDLPAKVEKNSLVTGLARWFLAVAVVAALNAFAKDIPNPFT